MNYSFLLSLLVTTVSPVFLSGYTVETSIEKNNDQQQSITLSFTLGKDELLYKNSLRATVNSPSITLTTPSANKDAVSEFDKTDKETKDVYKDGVTFTFDANKDPDKPVEDAAVHTSFVLNTSHEPQEKIVHLSFAQPNAAAEAEQSEKQKNHTAATTVSNQKATPCYPQQPSAISSMVQNGTRFISESVHSWRAYLSSLFETTGSRWLRLLVAFILGLLLSLTPCIYPMIPITVGILQTSESRSVFRNFLGAFAYTMGISCTFALLGFITALTSCVFGELQTKSWIVLPFVALLAYLGFAMFGLYELYIPKFLRPKATTVKGGSLLSAFVFGGISGTVASPCLSPGLALILAYVAKITQQATLFNYFEGFTTLFVFGIGSSLPLLIIGTFSSSIAFLPKAGLWMVEIKRILGLMLLATAFYQLEKFVPWHVLVWFIIAFLFAVGIYYLIDVKPYDSVAIRRYKNGIGTLFIIASCLMVVQGFKSWYQVSEQKESPFLPITYLEAVEKGKQENKKLLISFKTSYCVACKVLDSKTFADRKIQQILKNYIPVKIDATHAQEEPFATLKKQFDIKGFPTVVIQDPHNGNLIKKWVGDVGSNQEFLKELQEIK